ncbi:MAG: DUF5050 domain-containing protein [Eggerthellaceae bacterium]|nr:DUF5050 domain-containing protein [Eggerthellaceae bacterium]
MDDAAAFLGSYKEALINEVAESGAWPLELIERYEPESCLKHSGAKEVYLVTDKETGARVVLRASDLDAGERADAEHAILARLDFAGIPKTYGTFIKDGRSYLSREYFEGEPLDQVIARGTLEPTQVLQIARQICVILDYLHKQKPPIIHRDIKPQNIIVRPDNSIGLTDFGIARIYKEGSSSDTQYMGTLPYAPPEQYGYAQSSPQTDIYALGIVMIYLVCGSPDRRDLSKRITDSSLRALIEKCIAFDPENRFQDVRQIIKRIDSFKTRRRRIILGIVAACCALVLLGAGGAWLITQRDSVLPSSSFPYSSEPRLGSTAPLYDYTNGGNLHANLNNGGFAATADPGDSFYVISEGNIYHLDKDGNVLEQIYAGNAKRGLNICGSDLYFVEDEPGKRSSIYKIDLNSKTTTELKYAGAENIYFDKGQMYFTDPYNHLNLYAVESAGGEPILVDDTENVHYSNIVDGVRYYADGTDDKYHLYAKNLSTGESTLLYGEPSHWLSVWNGRIYFSDHTNHCLASIGLDGTDYRIAYGQTSSSIVASSRGIFAWDGISRDVFSIDVVSDNRTVLIADEYVDFCVAGDWIIYRERTSSTILGMVRQDGSETKLFSPEI